MQDKLTNTQLLGDIRQIITQARNQVLLVVNASNLRNMRSFYVCFPKCDALSHKLSWTHYRSLIRVENPLARQW